MKWVIILALGLFAYIFLIAGSVDSQTAPEQKKCPEGSYNIGIEKREGEIICKLEPTGCPYGDSVPMDMCDKVAPENTTSYNTKTVENAVESVGK